MFDRRLVFNFDFFLLLAVLVLCFLGVVNLKSICASSSQAPALYFNKQIYWALLGLGAIVVIININYVSIVRHAYLLHFFSLLLLCLVLFYGKTKLGSQRWIYLAGFSLQPSEFAKITFILALSKFFSENISHKPYTLKDLFFPCCLLLMTFFPIYLQPDLGTAGIVFLVFLFFVCLQKFNRRSLLYSLILLMILLPSSWLFMKDYQKTRIRVFLTPELDPLNAGYQVIQSKIAVGSGGVFGKGYQLGTQSQLRFLPEQHTDFVFSVWAEEWGFAGCLFLLLFYFFVIYRGLSIAHACKNFYGSFLAAGISFLFFIHLIINVFMTVGLFPVVGVPLPFLSYGGSFMLACFIGFAFLLNINMRRFK